MGRLAASARCDTIARMALSRSVLVASSVIACTLCAAMSNVGMLPPSPYPDTEVWTNVPFGSARSDVKSFEVLMRLAGSASNCVQVAFGRDVDGDGDLAPEETGLVLGWRAGDWFVENVPGCRRLRERAVGDVPVRVLGLRVLMDNAYVPRAASVTNEAGACFAELSTAPAWLFSPDWNLLKATRRGPVPADEWFQADVRPRSFALVFR